MYPSVNISPIMDKLSNPSIIDLKNFDYLGITIINTNIELDQINQICLKKIFIVYTFKQKMYRNIFQRKSKTSKNK